MSDMTKADPITEKNPPALRCPLRKFMESHYTAEFDKCIFEKCAWWCKGEGCAILVLAQRA